MSTEIQADAPALAPTNESAALAEAATQAMVAEVRAEQLKSETTKVETLVASNAAREAELAGEVPPAADAAPPAVTEEVDDGLPKLAVLLRAREKARATTDAAKSDAQRMRDEAMAQAKAEGERILSEARERGRKEYEAELDKVKRLRTHPLEAIKEIGWDRTQLVDEVAQAGTPQYQMQKRLEAQLESTRKELEEIKGWRGESQKQQEAWQQQQQRQAIVAVERQFLTLANNEVAPSLRALYDDAEIIQKAHATAALLRTEAGHEATLDEIRDYLEHEAKQRVAKLRGDQPAPATTDATKRPAKPTSPGPRSLSASATSERRATPKSAPTYANPTEEYLALREIAEAAMKETATPDKPKGV